MTTKKNPDRPRELNEADIRDEGSVSYLVLICLVAALGGLLFGYDTAVIAGAIDSLKQYFGLTATQEGWTASSALAGCVLGAMLAGVMSDYLGRKKVLIVCAVLFVISAVGTAVPRSQLVFVIFRALGGVGVGAASMTSPMYIAEISPARIRGRAMAVATICLWAANLMVSQTFPMMNENRWLIDQFHHAFPFWLYGLLSIVAVAFLVRFVPETKGRTLEEIEQQWNT